MMKKVYTFKTLLGHKHIGFSVECLNSFAHHAQDKIRLQIFDDGTLTEKDCEVLYSGLNDISIITRAEREAKVTEVLSGYPRCAHFRSRSVYAYKLFDVMLHDDADLWFVDSDIYFLKDFSFPEFGDTPAFILDKQNAYSFRPEEYLYIRHLIYPRVNTGLMFFPRRFFSLDFIEFLLSDPALKETTERLYWLEQTLWAFIAGRCLRLNYFDAKQVVMASDKLCVDNDTVAVHLVSSFRFQFESLKSLKRNLFEDGTVAQVRLRGTARVLNMYSFLMDRLKKKVYRQVGLLQ